jgi:putative membrane protein
MSRVMPITAALTALLATAPVALAQVTSDQDSVQPADTGFIRQTIRSNYLEVGLGRVADSRAEDDEVEEFGQRMVSDHNAMNDQWGRLARAADMDLDFVEDIRAAGEQSDELEDLSGSEFDQAYMSEMIRHHERELATFRRMRESARSEAVRDLADSGMSTISEHLDLARQVGSRVGVSTTAGRVGDDNRPSPSDDNRRRTTADRENTRSDRGAIRATDRAFIQNVLQDHLMHIRLAERAQREAKNDEIRRLAQRIEDDFDDWDDRWEDVAERYGIEPASHLGRLHRQKLERLEKASQGNIGRTYAAIVADHLESVVPYFQKEGQAVRPEAVRRLVDDELPMIRKHLEQARKLRNTK